MSKLRRNKYLVAFAWLLFVGLSGGVFHLNYGASSSLSITLLGQSLTRSAISNLQPSNLQPSNL
jgi:polyferredoxin